MRGAIVAALLCATLGGCAGSVESIYSSGLWVQPGKYDFIKCPDIARNIAAMSAQEKNLMKLMEKADQEMAGPLINITVYQAQLEQTRADLALLQRTSREKDCKAPPPAPAPAPPPRPTPRPHR